MPLNISAPTSGDFVPYIKMDGKAGRWFTKNDGEPGDSEVRDLTAIFDLENIKLGWLLFAEGMAPEAVWDNGKAEPQPSQKHKRGFSVNLFSPQNIGGLREFRANSGVAINAIKELYEQQFENAPERKQGLVPVVRCVSMKPIKSKFGTNYEPALKIIKWVPRPQAMDGAQLASPSPQNNGAGAPWEEDVPLPLQGGRGGPAQQVSAEEF
jgi:hypothetical protein